MTHTYNISGMTCNSCIAKVKSELLKIGDITQADVQLAAPHATISMQKHIPIDILQSAVQKAGNYNIHETHHEMPVEGSKAWFATYKPILLIFFYIILVTVIASPAHFNWMHSMNIFMSGFFLTFSFFKLLDLKGFAESYATYDIAAKKLPAWGFIYPFIELSLGISYAINFQPLITNLVTFVVMLISIIGVLQSLLNKRKIRCACLGAVFNLPMSTVTVIEDASMIAMSGIMLAVYIL